MRHLARSSSRSPRRGAEQLVVDAVRDLDHRYRGDQGLDLGRDAIVEHDHGPGRSTHDVPADPQRDLLHLAQGRCGDRNRADVLGDDDRQARAPCTFHCHHARELRDAVDVDRVGVAEHGAACGATTTPARGVGPVSRIVRSRWCPPARHCGTAQGRTVDREGGSRRRSRRNPLCSIRAPGGRRRVRYHRRAAASSGRRR